MQDLTSLNKELSLQIEDIEKQNNTLINEKESLSKDAIDYKETIRKLELTISPQKIITQKNDATDREKRLKVLRSLGFISYGGDDIDYFEVKNKYFNFTYPLKTAAELEYEGKKIISRNIIINDILIKILILCFLNKNNLLHNMKFSEIRSIIDISDNDYYIICRDLLALDYIEWHNLKTLNDLNGKALYLTNILFNAGEFFYEFGFEINNGYLMSVQKFK